MLTKNEKAQAIQFAMDLEQEKFNRYAIKALLLTFSDKERKELFDFWRNCCPLTQKAYAECCYMLDEMERNKSFFLMTKKEIIYALVFGFFIYIALVLVLLIWG